MQIPIELQLQRAIARAEKAASDCERIMETFRVMLEKADDDTLIKAAAVNESLFPEFDPNGHPYVSGEKFRYNGRLCRVKDGQGHTSQPDWTPDNATSLYEYIANENETGDEDAPIAYNGNMTLENGKRYTQDGVVYICFRDTGIAVYNALKDLVGIYVQVAN